MQYFFYSMFLKDIFSQIYNNEKINVEQQLIIQHEQQNEIITLLNGMNSRSEKHLSNSHTLSL